MTILSYCQPAVNLSVGIYNYMSTPSKKPIETVNIEGFTSAIRLAMFPYAAVSAKVKVDEFAINFDFPNKYWIFDTKSFSRYFTGESRKNFIIVKRIARIMLDLFPPVPQEKGKKLDPITNIYRHIIFGLEQIKSSFFSDQKMFNTVPVPETFDFDFDFKKYGEITDFMAGEAVQETINLFKYCCIHKFQPKQDLSPLQIEVKEIYNNLLKFQFSNGLDLLEAVQGETSVRTEWLCEYEFNSLNMLVEGRIAYHQKIMDKSNKMVPDKLINNQFEAKQKRNSNSPHQSLDYLEIKDFIKEEEKKEIKLNDEIFEMDDNDPGEIYNDIY